MRRISVNQAAFTGANSMRIRGHPSRPNTPTLVEYKSFSPNAKTLREAELLKHDGNTVEINRALRGGQARSVK
jgi:hypothetical protein